MIALIITFIVEIIVCGICVFILATKEVERLKKFDKELEDLARNKKEMDKKFNSVRAKTQEIKKSFKYRDELRRDGTIWF